MKVVILAGGFGSRISEESHLKPKPMIEIGGRPILWHIMKHYSHYGFNDFVICAGYKQHMIKEYFSNYFLYSSDVTFDYRSGSEDVIVHETNVEPWRITVADTGLNTMTAGRVRQIRKYVQDEPFMLTYGDGVSDVNIKDLLEFHAGKKKTVTITAASAPQRFGILETDDAGQVYAFREKSSGDGDAVNAGFMVVEPEVFAEPLLDGDDFSKVTLESLAEKGALAAYRHDGFWQPMDTQRDRVLLESMWQEGTPQWKVWSDIEKF